MDGDICNDFMSINALSKARGCLYKLPPLTADCTCVLEPSLICVFKLNFFLDIVTLLALPMHVIQRY